MPDKDDMARVLAEAHCRVEPDICRVVRLRGPNEDDENEPVKLLEVNPEALSAGIVPIYLYAAPPDVPYPSVVVEVTPAEFEQVQSQTLALPAGWALGDTLVNRAA